MTDELRLATNDDAAGIRRIYAPVVEESVISFERDPPIESEMAERITGTTKRYPWLVAEFEEIVGYAYAGSHRKRDAYRWSVDVSVYVDPAHYRRGIARALYTALFALLEKQGFYNAYAGITIPNPASTGFHESMGFTPVGIYHDVGYKDEKWHDVQWYERTLRERPADPEPPTAFPDLDPATVDRALETGESLLEL